MKPFFLYAVEDITTGKLVDHLTNPSHKFWFRKGDAETALRRASGRKPCRARSGGRPVDAKNLRLITLKVEEVTDES